MNVTKKTRQWLCIGAAVFAASVVTGAIAQPAAAPPGWHWGGANCGCASVAPNGQQNTIGCRNCCGGAPQGFGPGCIAFCLQADFPCNQGDHCGGGIWGLACRVLTPLF